MEESNKNNPFKTPEGYFDTLSDKLTDKLNEGKFDLPEADGFNVPEDYFDGVFESAQKKLDKSETKVIELHPYRKYYVAVASIAAILLVFFGLNWNTPKEVSWDDMTTVDLELYFDENKLELTSYEIAEVFPVDELEIDDILENQFDEENVIDYLNDNIDDFEELNIKDYE